MCLRLYSMLKCMHFYTFLLKFHSQCVTITDIAIMMKYSLCIVAMDSVLEAITKPWEKVSQADSQYVSQTHQWVYYRYIWKRSSQIWLTHREMISTTPYQYIFIEFKPAQHHLGESNSNELGLFTERRYFPCVALRLLGTLENKIHFRPPANVLEKIQGSISAAVQYHTNQLSLIFSVQL